MGGGSGVVGSVSRTTSEASGHELELPCTLLGLQEEIPNIKAMQQFLEMPLHLLKEEMVAMD